MVEASKNRPDIQKQTGEQKVARERMALFPENAEVLFVEKGSNRAALLDRDNSILQFRQTPYCLRHQQGTAIWASPIPAIGF